jgi:hypothetical protein
MNSTEIIRMNRESTIESALATAGSASMALYGVSSSTISFSCYENLPKPFTLLSKVIEGNNYQQEISNKLKKIDPSLCKEYENAWTFLYSADKDNTRLPMFSIREVIRRLYEYYAPDIKVREYLKLDENMKIDRRHQIKYITSLIKDAVKKQTFLDEEQAFVKIYKKLNKAHKNGELDIEATKGILYEANGLIKLIIDSLNT